MRRRTVQVTAKVDNSLREKVEAIKAEGYGQLTIVIEEAIKNYNLKPTDCPSRQD